MGGTILALVVAGTLAGGVVGLAIALVAWSNRDVPGAEEFALLAGCVGLWSFTTTALLFAPTETAAWIVDRIARIFAAQVAPLLLVFILAYAGHDQWLTPKWLALLWIYPTVYSILSVTASLHGLATTPQDVVTHPGHPSGITAYEVPTAAVEAAQLSFAYIVIFVALLVIGRLILRTRTVHRKQTIAIIAAVLIPVVTNLAFHAGLNVHPGIDITPATVVVSGLILGWALYQHDFLSVTPLASDVLLDELPDPVLILDENDRIVDHNPGASAAFGVGNLNDTALSDVAPDLDNHLDDGTIYSLPATHRTDGGEVAYYAPKQTPLEDQHGTDRGRLIVLRDVTGQQRRQSRLEALQSATQQFIAATSEHRIADLAVDFADRAFARHGAGVFLINEDGSKLLPAAVTDDAHEHYDDDDLVVGPDSPLFQSFLDGEHRTVDIDDESPFERYAAYPMGEHGVLVIGSRSDDALADDDVQFASILARTTQVALAQVERERELRASRKSVERRSEQIEFFNGILRHTLRNALLVIQGRADHLREEVPRGAREHIDKIEEWCNDLADLTEDIRTINQTVTSSEAEQLEAVDLSKLLRERVGILEEEFPEVSISVDVPPDVYVEANELLCEVVDSIIANAVRHNDSDQPRVSVSAVPSEEWVQVRIADNGPGISDDLKERVFERDVATTQTSHGFGLYFVSVMMNLYSGAVWFEDNEPRGTIAVLEFQTPDPAEDDDAGPAAEEVSAAIDEVHATMDETPAAADETRQVANEDQQAVDEE